MYAIVSLGVTFICYTGQNNNVFTIDSNELDILAFLIFGLKPREPEKKKEE